MKIYTIEYGIEFQGSIDIQANSEQEAKDLFYEFSWEQIIADASYLNEEIDVYPENE